MKSSFDVFPRHFQTTRFSRWLLTLWINLDLMTKSSRIMTTASGKLNCTTHCITTILVVDLWSEQYGFCRATFDRIAEININIDAGQDSVSLFHSFVVWIYLTAVVWAVILLHCSVFMLLILHIRVLTHFSETLNTHLFTCFMQRSRWSLNEMTDLCLYRLIQLCLRPVPRRGSNPLMMMRRRRRKTFGRRKRSVLQHKQSPVRGQVHTIKKPWSLYFVSGYSWFFFFFSVSYIYL